MGEKKLSYDDLKVGSLVRLKSGGPTMTVTYIHGDKDRNDPWKIRCSFWWNSPGSGGMVDASFPVDALVDETTND